MKIILHMVSEQDLPSKTTVFYSTKSLDIDGFIHCSTQEQLSEVANYIFEGRQDLYLLVIDEDKINAEVKYEDAGNGKLYPHIYGKINLNAVMKIIPYKPNEDGKFVDPVL